METTVEGWLKYQDTNLYEKRSENLILQYHTPNIVVKWLRLQLCIREVLGSILGPSDRLSWGSSWFYSVPPDKCLDSTLKLGHDRFLPNPFQSIFHLAYHSTLHSLVTEKASLNKLPTNSTIHVLHTATKIPIKDLVNHFKTYALETLTALKNIPLVNLLSDCPLKYMPCKFTFYLPLKYINYSIISDCHLLLWADISYTADTSCSLLM
jgi:hypothetical protein